MAKIVKDLGVVTAYAYAVEGGYTGTEAEFEELIGNIGIDLETIENLTASASGLPAGSSPTASYSNGNIAFGIPKGDTGETGATGPEGPTGNGIASISKTGTSGLVDTYTITYTNGNTTTFTVTNGETVAIDTTLTHAGEAADAKATGDAIDEVKEDLTQKANADGYAENLISGMSEQLDSKNVMTNQVPYVFRKTPTGAGTRKRETIVGGTVNWNQLIESENKSADFTTSNTEYIIKAIQGVSFLVDHVYFLNAKASVSSNGKWRFRYPNVSADFTSSASTVTKTTNNSFLTAFSIQIYSNDGEEATFAFDNFMIIDLTAMFGSTIADYINTLETANAGDGVALFRSLFPNDYYSYSAAGLESVKVSGHKTVGFNQWDEEWEVGRIDTTDGTNKQATGIRSKNYVRVLPSNAYYVKASANVYFIEYDADKNYIRYANYKKNETYTTGANAHYIRFYQVDIATYNHDICINLSDTTKNGTYEPYKAHSYPLDDVVLRGIPKIDASGNLYFEGDEYTPDGTVGRNIDFNTFNGTENWVQSSANVNTFYANIERADMPYKHRGNMVCYGGYPFAGFTSANYSTKIGNQNGMCAYASDTAVSTISEIAFKDLTCSTLEEWKAKLASKPLTVAYELATPTTEEAAPFVPVMAVDPDGTEEYIDAGVTASTPTRDVAIPAGHYSEYPTDQVAKLDGLPKDFSTLIAPTEQTYTATRNYTSGALLIVNNVLYKATANIANGGSITPNTNVTATTLAEIIAAL